MLCVLVTLVNLGFDLQSHLTCNGTGHPALYIGGLVISGVHNGKTAQIIGGILIYLGGGASTGSLWPN